MSMTETVPVACLRSVQGAPVPLLGVSISGRVFGAHARVVLRQRYINRETRPIEAVYTFPVPADAALVGFAMETSQRRLSAVVQEREQAFAAYDAALSAGHGAALLDQERTTCSPPASATCSPARRPWSRSCTCRSSGPTRARCA